MAPPAITCVTRGLVPGELGKDDVVLGELFQGLAQLRAQGVLIAGWRVPPRIGGTTWPFPRCAGAIPTGQDEGRLGWGPCGW